MAEKQIYKYPDGSTLVYYQQNYNKCTDVNVGFRIPLLDIPNDDEAIGLYKNLLFYINPDSLIRIPINKPGIAHFVEHMFFSSLPDMPRKEIFSKLMKTNTIYNAVTSQDYIKTEFNCPSKFAEEIFELEGKLIFRDSYNKEDLENEKRPIYQELEMTLDSPKDVIYNLFTRNYENLRGEEILGIDKKIIESISERQLVNFGKTYFTKQNLVMTVVSDLPFEKIKDLCEKNFVNKAPSIIETKIETPKKSYTFSNDLMVLQPNKQQNTATIEFVLKGSNDYEKNALYSNIESFMLNDFNGRLFEKFRNNNGMVYTPSFETLNLPQQPLKIFSIQTTPKNVPTCINNLADILDDVLKNGITDDEYNGFKEMWESRRERKTSIKYNTADSLFEKVIYDEPIFVNDFYEKTKAITKEEINQYIWDTYSKSKLCVVVSGNFNRKKLMPLQKVLAKYRPYDKYLDKNYLEHDLKNEFYDYLDWLKKHPDEKSDITFIGSESLDKNILQSIKSKTQSSEDVDLEEEKTL